MKAYSDRKQAVDDSEKKKKCCSDNYWQAIPLKGHY